MKLIVLVLLALVNLSVVSAELKTKNVFLITTDGLRWEEVFQGADLQMISKEFGNISNTNVAQKKYWREAPEVRREILMPFLWTEVAKKGQLFGNRAKKSDMRVTNGRNFSYPGYNEFLTGIADPKIDSNDKNLNANTNVFEWLNSKPAYQGKVAAVVNWDVLPWILNGPRSQLPIWSAFEMPQGTRKLEISDELDELADKSKTVWDGVILDTFISFGAKLTVKKMKPRAMYISYGETDDWAHEGAYGRYLKAASEFDRFIGELWNLVQSMPEYRDSTTFIITVDHGRGPAPVAWKNHGANITESAYMWFAAMGPDIAPLGERRDAPLLTQSQIAATVAAALGEDFLTGSPTAAKPISFAK